MSRGRKLSAEEHALWDSVARQAVPLGPKCRPDPPPEAPAIPAKEPDDRSPVPGPRLPAFRVGEKASPPETLNGRATDGAAAAAPRMDAKSFGRMRRGKLAPEARIDLHGMTLDEAHPALIGFILKSQAEGRRLVLVITGKGQRTDAAPLYPRRRGILRQQVPQWLRLPPLAPLVLEVTPAHVRHGGEGAFYVYLRRGR